MTVSLVEVTRRDVRTGTPVVESEHHGHLVVSGPDGEVVAALGEPERVTLVRSAAKPFQAAACLEVLADHGPGLDAAEIAVAWSSHRAEPRHLEVVRRLLARSGTPADELTCPVAVGEADRAAAPARIRCDCSGKHALFALAGQRMGVSGDDLLDPDGPLQREVLRVLGEATAPSRHLAIDGCGAPAVAVPLVALARGYAALAAGGRWARVRDAGFAHPELIGGDGRAETALLENDIVAKPGAEGVFAAGVLDERGEPHGLAIKVTDGASRGAAVAAVAVLESLGRVTPGIWSAPAPTGGGQIVGDVRPSAAVRDLADRVV